jgi:hypothetical protein
MKDPVAASLLLLAELEDKVKSGIEEYKRNRMVEAERFHRLTMSQYDAECPILQEALADIAKFEGKEQHKITRPVLAVTRPVLAVTRPVLVAASAAAAPSAPATVSASISAATSKAAEAEWPFARSTRPHPNIDAAALHATQRIFLLSGGVQAILFNVIPKLKSAFETEPHQLVHAVDHICALMGTPIYPSAEAQGEAQGAALWQIYKDQFHQDMMKMIIGIDTKDKQVAVRLCLKKQRQG